ncbi:uncharacterized protein [Panulirus ornatus]|uniref:uncharacterized protein n=1 Tax=Panulirus ornatus TaxID=150431 RepID=UPI003A85D233
MFTFLYVSPPHDDRYLRQRCGGAVTMVSVASLLSILSVAVLPSIAQLPRRPYGGKETLEVAGGAVEAVLAGERPPHCSVILLTDGTTSATTVFTELKRPRTLLGRVVFEVAVKGKNINKTQAQVSWMVSEARKLQQVSGCVTLVVVSDDPAFLAASAEWSLKVRLLTWSNKLLAVTRRPLQDLPHLYASFSMMNAMLITVNTPAPHARCQIFVHLPYRPPDAQVVRVASWSTIRGLTLATHLPLFPEKFSRFAFAPSFVAVAEEYPSYVETFPSWKPGQPLNYGGPVAQLLALLASNSNFTYTFVRSLDGQWGTKKADGSWTGMVGMVLRKEVDLGVGPFSLNGVRAEVVDYMDLVVHDTLEIIGGLGRPEVDPWGFLLPLGPLVWTAILAALLVVPGMVLLLLFCFPRKAPQRDTWKRDNIFLYFRILLQQGYKPEPGEWGWERLVLGSWMMMALVFFRSYDGNLMSMLAVRYIPQPYQSLRDVLDDPSATMIWETGSVYMQFLRTVKTGTFREVMDAMKDGDVVMVTTSEYRQVLETLVVEGRHVLIVEENSGRSLRADLFSDTGRCDFYTSREHFLATSMSMIGQKGHPLIPALNKRIKFVKEFGIFDHWLKSFKGNSTICLRPPTKITIQSSLALSNLWGMFVVLAGGHAVRSSAALSRASRCSAYTDLEPLPSYLLVALISTYDHLWICGSDHESFGKDTEKNYFLIKDRWREIHTDTDPYQYWNTDRNIIMVNRHRELRATDLDDRVRLVLMWLKGTSVRDIAQKTGISLSTVYRWIRVWRKEGNVYSKRCRCLHRIFPRVLGLADVQCDTPTLPARTVDVAHTFQVYCRPRTFPYVYPKPEEHYCTLASSECMDLCMINHNVQRSVGCAHEENTYTLHLHPGPQRELGTDTRVPTIPVASIEQVMTMASVEALLLILSVAILPSVAQLPRRPDADVVETLGVAGGAVEAVLARERPPHCSVILLTDGTTSATELGRLRVPLGLAVFDVAGEGNNPNMTQRQLSWMGWEALRVCLWAIICGGGRRLSVLRGEESSLDPWSASELRRTCGAAAGLTCTKHKLYGCLTRYTFVRPPDGKWGTKEADGSWTGMVGMVGRKTDIDRLAFVQCGWMQEVDMGVGPFSLTAVRAEMVDYMMLFVDDALKIIGGLGRPEVDPWGFLLPLGPLVWTAILAALLLVPGMVLLLLFCSPRKAPQGKRWQMETFLYFRILLHQGYKPHPDELWLERLVLGSWMVMTLVLNRSYDGNLMSMLAVRYIPQPYQSLRDVLDEPSITMIWLAGSAYIQHLRTMKTGELGEVMDTMKEGRLMLVTTTEYRQVLETLVAEGRHVLIIEENEGKSIRADVFSDTGRCDFYTSREHYFPNSMSMIGQKGHPLVPALSKSIKFVKQFGIFDYWLRSFKINATRCLRPPSRITIKSSLTVYNLWGMFVVLAGGHAVALLLLCVELLTARFVQTNTSPSPASTDY